MDSAASFSSYAALPLQANKRRVQLNVADELPPDAQVVARRVAGASSSRLPISGFSQASTHKRLAAPRLSLLGKPIYLSSHKSNCRNTRSMRLKMRLRAFLEQPQGLPAWLYHSAL